MQSAFESPGSIRKPSITFGFPSRPETPMLLWSIVGIDPCDIYGGHLSLHTGRTLQSPAPLSLSFPPCLPHENFAAGVALSSCCTKKQKGGKKREREVVVLFVDDEERSYRESRTICLSGGASQTRMFLIRHLPSEAPAFLVSLSVFFSMLCYITRTYTLLSSRSGQRNHELRVLRRKVLIRISKPPSAAEKHVSMRKR